MQEDQSSRTAGYMALFRALEGRLPVERRLFVDPLARDFLTLPFRSAVDLARIPGVAQLLCDYTVRYPFPHPVEEVLRVGPHTLGTITPRPGGRKGNSDSPRPAFPVGMGHVG